MNTPKLVLLLLFLTGLSYGQQAVKRFEIGITPVTVYSQFGDNFLVTSKIKVEYLNGIYFRYTKNRFGIRSFASYYQTYTDFYGTHNALVNPKSSSAILYYYDFKIGAGAQYILVKKANEFYTFADVDYNRINWNGRAVNDCGVGPHYYEVASINAINCYLGIGLKFKIKNTISLSPEISSNIFSGVESNTRTDIQTGITTNDLYNLADHHLVLKFHLNYMF